MKQGSIVVLPVPFTDLTASKQRPCLIISNDRQNNSSDDLIVLAITSNAKALKGILSMSLEQEDMQKGILPKKSYVRIQKIFSIHKRLVRKEVCKLKKEVLKSIIDKFNELIIP